MALALAGFSGITIAFVRLPGRLTPLESYRLSLLFGTTFGAMFLGLLPLGIAVLGVEAGAAWRASSALMAAYSVAFVGSRLGPSLRFMHETPEVFHRWILGSNAVIHLANAGVQTAVALGAFEERREGIYVWGVLWFLFHGAQQFSRILFIRPREAEGISEPATEAPPAP
ncbi:MAG TPA: hypothetical protein VM778_03185 [Gemmatimonadota bacterium]|nr:hypothetical protein [Gemmatimonadota bacterium]